MTDRLIQPPTSTPVTPGSTDLPVEQDPGAAVVERPGEHGPLSGTTGHGPLNPPTPGKSGTQEGQK